MGYAREKHAIPAGIVEKLSGKQTTLTEKYLQPYTDTPHLKQSVLSIV